MNLIEQLVPIMKGKINSNKNDKPKTQFNYTGVGFATMVRNISNIVLGVL